jgi:hypothetical protein
MRTHERACVGTSMGRHSCRSVRGHPASNGNLDRCVELDGNGVHSQCQAVRTYPLPLRRPLFFRDDRAGRWAGLQLRHCRHMGVGLLGRRHSRRICSPVEGERASVGQILFSTSCNKRQPPENPQMGCPQQFGERTSSGPGLTQSVRTSRLARLSMRHIALMAMDRAHSETRRGISRPRLANAFTTENRRLRGLRPRASPPGAHGRSRQ